MEISKEYFVGVRFDEKDEHPIICNGGNIFDSYEICRHDTADNAEVMRVVPMTMPSNELTAVENIANALQKEVDKCDNELDIIAEMGVKGETDLAKALIYTAHKEAYEKAIVTAETLF